MDMISILKEECLLEHDKISMSFEFAAKAELSSLLRTLPAANFFIRAHYLGYFLDPVPVKYCPCESVTTPET
jgi:hypothetical protein